MFLPMFDQLEVEVVTELRALDSLLAIVFAIPENAEDTALCAALPLLDMVL